MAFSVYIHVFKCLLYVCVLLYDFVCFGGEIGYQVGGEGCNQGSVIYDSLSKKCVMYKLKRYILCQGEGAENACVRNFEPRKVSLRY